MAAAEAALYGYAFQKRKVVGVGEVNQNSVKCKDSSKTKGKAAPKKRSLALGGDSSKSSSTPNPLYASKADSKVGNFVRDAPGKSKASEAIPVGPLRDPEAEKMRITRAMNERMLKVNHVEGRALANREEPERFFIDIPNRFKR